jgi:hypothetical protein
MKFTCLEEKIEKKLFFFTQAAQTLTPQIPWDQKLVDCCLGSLCEEK